MAPPFRLLRIFSVLFKILAWVLLVLMLIGFVGLVVASKGAGGPERGQAIQAMMQMAVSGVIFFLIFFALGEIIRILLAIESQTRKE